MFLDVKSKVMCALGPLVRATCLPAVAISVSGKKGTDLEKQVETSDLLQKHSGTSAFVAPGAIPPRRSRLSGKHLQVLLFLGSLTPEQWDPDFS